MDQSGLRRNAAYLVRPDGVALADPKANTASLQSYLDTLELFPPTGAGLAPSTKKLKRSD